MVLFKGPLAGFSLTSSWNCGREESLRDPYVTSHSVALLFVLLGLSLQSVDPPRKERLEAKVDSEAGE